MTGTSPTLLAEKDIPKAWYNRRPGPPAAVASGHSTPAPSSQSARKICLIPSAVALIQQS